jgi:hypothetical protein
MVGRVTAVGEGGRVGADEEVAAVLAVGAVLGVAMGATMAEQPASSRTMTIAADLMVASLAPQRLGSPQIAGT